MIRQDDDPMDRNQTFDALIDTIRAREVTPGPSQEFVRGLEDRLMTMGRSVTRPRLHPQPEITGLLRRRGWQDEPHRLRPTPPAGRVSGLMAACLIVIALGAGGLGIRRLGIGATPEPATIAAFVGATPADPYGDVPSASPTAATLSSQEVSCTTPGREAGTFDAIMSGSSGLSRRSFTPIVTNGVSAAVVPVLDGDYYLAGYPEIHDERVAAINAALTQLWACRFETISGATGMYDGDAPYWALHTGTALRRAAADAPEGLSAFNMLEDLTLRDSPYPVSAVRVHEFESFGISRVAAVLSGPPPCRDLTTVSTQPGYLVVFALVDDRWLVDEIAIATFDDVPVPSAPLAPEPLDLVVGDIVDGERVNDGNLFLYGTCNTALWADELAVLRVHNTGDQTIVVAIETLGIEIEVRPGEVDAVEIQSPAGRVDYSIVEVDNKSTAYGTLTVVAPGDPRPVG